MQRVIDAHIHLSERRDDLLLGYAKTNRLRYTLKELLSTMLKYHVEHGLLLSPPMGNGIPLPNERIIELCRRSKGVLSPAVTVEPTKKEVAAAIRFAKDNHGDVKAFKIRLGYLDVPAESPVFADLYDYAEGEGLPVLFHTGDTASSKGNLVLSHPLRLDSLANTREELTMVLCHFGNPWFEDVAELIYKHPNVYADISGLTTGSGGVYARRFSRWLAQKISEAVYFAGGAEKIIFGTDYPITKYTDALNLVKIMEVTEADKQKILWRNAKTVFGF